jgi:AcrR family transcriptional regulator
MSLPTRKFRRIQPEARRETLVEAALACLAEGGHQGVSVRRIAARAGVSLGLVNHYYAGIDQLIAQAYESLADGIVSKLLESAESADVAPRERLSGFIRTSFSPLVLDPKLLRVWVVFWSLIPHSTDMQAVQDRSHTAYCKVLERYLKALAAERGLTPVDLPVAAIGLSALLDGLWLEWCLNPAKFRPEEGITLCESWVDAFAAGAFPRLAR